ncbi:uncharacterized protein LOC120203015 [Hibiscus syriacus]|uniref:uncharacterized protein LOC120203015 n=1 Tax=Hibiscus syriacus TaxID=106335 RepID=UPI001924C18D|nr:uncharacterized protein LOC120203015 [Hibiscus syriacus]
MQSEREMESRGGCCIANRYEACGVYYTSKVDRIMLRFRPIAPKPANDGGGSVSPRENGAEGYCKLGRGRRRQSKESNNNTKRRKMVTLPLISETPDCKDSISMENTTKKMKMKTTTMPLWLSVGEADKTEFRFLRRRRR